MGKKYTPETAQRFFDKYRCFEYVKFTAKEVNKHYHEWQNGNHFLFNDFLWSLFNKAVMYNSENYRKTGNEADFHQNNRMIYSDMALFRKEEGASKESVNQMLDLAEKSSLYNSNIGGVEMQVIVISGHCCDYCNSLNDNRYDFDEYIMNPALDRSKCKRESACNCCTSAIAKRDKNGGFILK